MGWQRSRLEFICFEMSKKHCYLDCVLIYFILVDINYLRDGLKIKIARCHFSLILVFLTHELKSRLFFFAAYIIHLHAALCRFSKAGYEMIDRHGDRHFLASFVWPNGSIGRLGQPSVGFASILKAAAGSQTYHPCFFQQLSVRCHVCCSAVASHLGLLQVCSSYSSALRTKFWNRYDYRQ